ncbi:MAG: hypothetical protein GY773_22455, partial [Actinomycetia bacterium]|nr:hypothetical protein [Actinomycetes bacterium]
MSKLVSHDGGKTDHREPERQKGEADTLQSPYLFRDSSEHSEKSNGAEQRQEQQDLEPSRHPNCHTAKRWLVTGLRPIEPFQLTDVQASQEEAAQKGRRTIAINDDNPIVVGLANESVQIASDRAHINHWETCG